MTTTVNTKRLLKLAAFLDKLPRNHFDFGVTRDFSPKNQCGTVGCAIGWCPEVFPRACKFTARTNTFTVGGKNIERNSWGFTPEESEWAAAGKKLFCMPRGEAGALFTPDCIAPGTRADTLPNEATPKQVAKRIRRYVRWVLKGRP